MMNDITLESTLVRRLEHGKMSRALCLEAGDRIEELEATIKRMRDVYHAATSSKALISNQGQGMDGYSELASYRSILEALEKDDE